MMRFTSITILASVVSFAAQSAPGPQGASGSSTSSARAETRSVTGCLRAGTTPAAFVLIVPDEPRDDPGKTQTSAAGDTSTAASPRVAGTAGAAVKTTTYQLVPQRSSVDFRRYVGQRVEVTGTVDPSSGRAARPSRGAEPPSTPNRGKDDGALPTAAGGQTQVQGERFQVTSVRAVGGSCE